MCFVELIQSFACLPASSGGSSQGVRAKGAQDQDQGEYQEKRLYSILTE